MISQSQRKTLNYLLLIFLFMVFFAVDVVIANDEDDGEIFDTKNTNCSGHKFLVAGHIYGNYKNEESIYPSSSFVANIDTINQHSSSFLVLLGDSYRKSTVAHIEAFKASVIDKIDMPIYSVIGNHESVDRSVYADIFGDTYFSFFYCENLYIFIDSEESEHSHFSDNQLEFLKGTLQTIQGVKNVFIFSHKLIWASQDNKYQPVWNAMNVRGKQADYGYYISNIRPLINEISNTSSVYFISGDIGLLSPETVFYDKDDYVSYIATGLGDRSDDNILAVSISAEHSVDFDVIPLAHEPARDITSYGLSAWSFDQHPDSSKLYFRYLWFLLKALFILVIGFVIGFWCRNYYIKKPIKLSRKEDTRTK